MSGAAPDVVTTLIVNGDARRPARVWAYESVPFLIEFRDGARGPLFDVDGVSIAFLRPDGEAPIAPSDFLVRLEAGRYLCRLVPALAGLWQAVARCTSPTASVDVKPLTVVPLPAGTPPPPTTLLTDDSGTFLLLTADGAMISV